MRPDIKDLTRDEREYYRRIPDDTHGDDPDRERKLFLALSHADRALCISVGKLVVDSGAVRLDDVDEDGHSLGDSLRDGRAYAEEISTDIEVLVGGREVRDGRKADTEVAPFDPAVVAKFDKAARKVGTGGPAVKAIDVPTSLSKRTAAFRELAQRWTRIQLPPEYPSAMMLQLLFSGVRCNWDMRPETLVADLAARGVLERKVPAKRAAAYQRAVDEVFLSTDADGLHDALRAVDRRFVAERPYTVRRVRELVGMLGRLAAAPPPTVERRDPAPGVPIGKVALRPKTTRSGRIALDPAWYAACPYCGAAFVPRREDQTSCGRTACRARASRQGSKT